MSDSIPAVTRRARKAVVSRRRILDAAVDCLVEVGYAEASTLMVQRRAGVSRGGLLHHFPSKEALFVAAATLLSRRRVADTAARTAEFGCPDGSVERIDEAIAAMWERHGEAFFRASIELWLAAQHHPALRGVVYEAERGLNESIHAIVAGMFGPAWAAHPEFPALRETLLTSMRGTALVATFGDAGPRHERMLEHWRRLARGLLAGPAAAP
ncbi:TetR/AcrR family transcriptional regulator [Pseudonocardia pini]|uniref:TetR/AcrR family transcriptional regulator n=1 Tax=Pseudonocardia pini TaxID=2758030 RepID=UPI0015F0643C|nr:TetR/AcrR family transcriptional regulator [Pseudonocardia pini]